MNGTPHLQEWLNLPNDLSSGDFTFHGDHIFTRMSPTLIYQVFSCFLSFCFLTHLKNVDKTLFSLLKAALAKGNMGTANKGDFSQFYFKIPGGNVEPKG